MGFLDKAREQAEKLAKQGQGKLDEVQSKKKADGLLRDLGAWYYAAQTDRDHGQGTVEMNRIVAELRAHEAEHGPLGGDDAAPSSPSSGPGPQVHAVPTMPPPAPAGIVPPPPSPPGPSTDPGQSTEPTPPPPPAPPTAFPPPTAPPGSGGGFTVDDL